MPAALKVASYDFKITHSSVVIAVMNSAEKLAKLRLTASQLRLVSTACSLHVSFVE